MGTRSCGSVPQQLQDFWCMSLNTPLKAGLHLGDQSVRRMSAKQRWGMHREEFPRSVLWKAAALG